MSETSPPPILVHFEVYTYKYIRVNCKAACGSDDLYDFVTHAEASPRGVLVHITHTYGTYTHD